MNVDIPARELLHHVQVDLTTWLSLFPPKTIADNDLHAAQ